MASREAASASSLRSVGNDRRQALGPFPLSLLQGLLEQLQIRGILSWNHDGTAQIMYVDTLARGIHLLDCTPQSLQLTIEVLVGDETLLLHESLPEEAQCFKRVDASSQSLEP